MNPPIPIADPALPRRAHLIGIGGSGMRALARVLLENGWRLSGSDLTIAANDPLATAGIRCFAGHAAEQVCNDVDCVIHSSAIADVNPELGRARYLGIPIVSYAEMLGLLMRGRCGLAVAGTHGKSTTTAMAAEILLAAGCDPTVICGATWCDGRECGRAGKGNAVLVEACEFRQNFLNLRPRDAVILNMELDHFDCYDSIDEIESAFSCFAASLPADGRLIVPFANQPLRRVIASAVCRSESFGLQEGSDWMAADVRSSRGQYGFDLVHGGKDLGRVELSVFGEHNVLNALAAAALSASCGVSPAKIIEGLSQFSGLQRRLEPLGTVGGVTFWDDYAHHPTAILATLRAVREASPGARVWCLFQPHQALRTARLLDELALSLQNAERVLIADIFRAREGPPQPGEIVAADLAARTRALGQDVPELHASLDIQQFLQTRLAPGDVLVVMGAGDIGRIAHGLMDWFRKRCAAG
jgi:UDP-N-acetylmuramate--alanine ligase